MPATRSIPPLRTFGFLLKDVARLYLRNFERHSAGLGLTLEQCKVLSRLQRHEGVSQARLAELTDTDPMTLGRLLERMDAEGLVERQVDPADRRAHRLRLRGAALPVLDEIWRVADRSRAQALAGLSAADRAQLMKLMQRIHANLDALHPAPPEAPGAAPRPGRAQGAAKTARADASVVHP